MLLNNFISATCGLVPFVGDVVLASFKANSRNAALLEEYLRIRGAEYLRLKEEGKDVAAVVDSKNRKAGKWGKVAKKKSGIDDKSAVIATGVAKSDAQQIKPGAGRETNEVIPSEIAVPSSSTLPGPTLAVDSPNGTSEKEKKTGESSKHRGFRAWIKGAS
jgi:hypothetical protein